MEALVQEFGAKFEIVGIADSVWAVIMQNVHKRIEAMPKTDAVRVSLAKLAAHLDAVRIAWRNEVMHPRAHYTSGEARTLFRHVCTFATELGHAAMTEQNKRMDDVLKRMLSTPPDPKVKAPTKKAPDKGAVRKARK